MATINGTNGNDFPLNGTNSADDIFGFDGSDFIYGSWGDDVIHGGNDEDVIYGEGDEDEIYGDNGDDTIYGGHSLDTLYGGAGWDYLDGGDGDDMLDGGDDNDTLKGGEGNDTLIGGNGSDTAVWDYSSYTGGYFVVYRALDGEVYVVDTFTNQGTDHVNGDVEYIQYFNTVNSTFNTAVSISGLSLVAGGAGWGTAAAVQGSSSANTINGYAGVDIIAGGDGNDTIHGNQGDDTIDGEVDDDMVYGDAGNDVLDGSSGADQLYGGDGDDLLRGGTGDDILSGGNGTDKAIWNTATSDHGLIIYRASDTYVYVKDTSDLVHGFGTDKLIDIENVEIALYGGGSFNSSIAALDLVAGGAGWGTAATVTGNNSGETFNGYVSKDIIYGEGGADTFNGSYGDDELHGGDGSDTFYSDQGNDVLYGDGGADYFVYEESTAYDAVDTIMDFNTGQGDVIDISDLLAEYDPLTEALTDFVRIDTISSHSMVNVDRDGTGSTYGFTAVTMIYGVTGLTDEVALATNGNLIV